MNHTLFEGAKFLNIGADSTGAPSATDFQANVVDTFGFGGVAFLVTMPTLTDAGAIYLKVQSADSSATTSLVSADTSTYSVGVAVTAATHAGQTIVADVKQPPKRFMSTYVDKTAQATRVECFVILYDPVRLPVTRSTADNVGLAAYAEWQTPTS